MGFNGTTIINQLGFHEHTNFIDNAEGRIYLDLHLSTTHVIYPKSDIMLFIESIPEEDNIPNSMFMDCNIFVFSKYQDVTVEFDPIFLLTNTTLYDNIKVLKNYLLSIYMYSIDSGKTWRTSSLMFTPTNNGYNILDTSVSNTVFNGCISSSLNDTSINIAPKINFDFINDIKLGNGNIKITQIGD